MPSGRLGSQSWCAGILPTESLRDRRPQQWFNPLTANALYQASCFHDSVIKKKSLPQYFLSWSLMGLCLFYSFSPALCAQVPTIPKIWYPGVFSECIAFVQVGPQYGPATRGSHVTLQQPTMVIIWQLPKRRRCRMPAHTLTLPSLYGHCIIFLILNI